MIEFVFLVVAAFFAMEIFSYVVHRYVYHGLLWAIHKSHHTPRMGPFELNDLFPLVLSLSTMGLLLFALRPPVDPILLPVSIGISMYGATYFFIHDLYIHRRVRALRIRIPFLSAVKQAHAIHHGGGGEPYGLLFFAKLEDLRRFNQEADDSV